MKGSVEVTDLFAVWKGKELLAVVCYKKGAQTLKQVLTDLLNKPATDKQTK